MAKYLLGCPIATECKCLKSCLKFKLHEKRLNGEDTDITIFCKDNTALPAHRLVLVSANPYFEKMFSGMFVESKTREVRLNFDPKTLNTVLDFLYLQTDAKIRTLDNLDQAEDMLDAAHMLQMTSMFNACCNEVDKIMNEDSFFQIESWNQVYESPRTAKLLHDQIKKFWQNMVMNNEYLKFDLPQFKVLIEYWSEFNYYCIETKSEKASKFLRSQKQLDATLAIEMSAEIESALAEISKKVQILDLHMVFKVIQWIKVNSDERSQHIETLFARVEKPHLSSNFVRILLKDKFVITNCNILLLLLKCVMTEKHECF